MLTERMTNGKGNINSTGMHIRVVFVPVDAIDRIFAVDFFVLVIIDVSVLMIGNVWLSAV